MWLPTYIISQNHWATHLMNRNSFSIDAAELEKVCDSKSVSVLQKGILLELLTRCWNADTPGKTAQTLASVAISTGIAEGELRDVVTKFTDSGYLSEELCLDTFDAHLGSPKLADQYQEYLAWVDSIELETKSQKRARELSELRLVHLIKTDVEEDRQATVGYLSHEDRRMGSYAGWLPTNRFNGSGQVFYITESFLADLTSEFKNADVNASILAIYTWLMRNPTRRKTLAHLPLFISNWIKNSTAATQKSDVVDFDELDIAFQKEFG